MRVARFATAVIAAAVGSVPAVAVISTPVAFADADPAVHDLGDQATLMDGSAVQGWTISGLKKSSDTIPYPVQGTLWEATATDEALQDQAVPIVSNFNARTPSGQTYRTLFQVATPEGVNPATLAQNQKTTGKLYFDATDETPDSVVYNDGSRDRAVWVQPPAPMQRTAVQTPRPAASRAIPGSTDAASTGSDAGTVPASPDSQEAAVPAGRQGTPEAPGWQGTPLPAASQGGLQPVASQGAPQPSGWQGTPLPAENQGTPLPAASQGTPLPAASQGTPEASGWQGTPLPAANQAGADPGQTAPAFVPQGGGPALAAPSTSVAPPPAADGGASTKADGASTKADAGQ